MVKNQRSIGSDKNNIIENLLLRRTSALDISHWEEPVQNIWSYQFIYDVHYPNQPKPQQHFRSGRLGRVCSNPHKSEKQNKERRRKKGKKGRGCLTLTLQLPERWIKCIQRRSGAWWREMAGERRPVPWQSVGRRCKLPSSPATLTKWLVSSPCLSRTATWARHGRRRWLSVWRDERWYLGRADTSTMPQADADDDARGKTGRRGGGGGRGRMAAGGRVETATPKRGGTWGRRKRRHGVGRHKRSPKREVERQEVEETQAEGGVVERWGREEERAARCGRRKGNGAPTPALPPR